MSEVVSGRSPALPKPLPWIVSMLIGHSLGAGVIVAVGGAALHASAHDLVIPFLLLDSCVLVFAPLLIWTYRVPRGSKAFGVRSAVLAVAWLEALCMAFVFSGIRLGAVSRADGLHSLLPFLAIVIAAGSPLEYGLMRAVFSAKQAGRNR